MTVPTVIGDLSTTALDNAPSGEDAPSTLDNIQRAHASFIAQLRDEKQAASGKDASGGYAGLTLFKLNLRNAADTFTSWLTNAATAARTWTMPDKDGTIAMTNDFAAPPAIGNTTPAAGSFTTLTASGATTLASVTATQTSAGAITYPLLVRNADSSLDGTGAGQRFYAHASAATGQIESVRDTGGNYSLRLSTFINASALTETLRLKGTGGVDVLSGGLTVTTASLLGYGIGAGGTVTQATSRTTGVTLSKPTGAITLFTAAGSATPATFTVTNSLVAATDIPEVVVKSSTNVYLTKVTAVAAGSFNITFWTTGGTTSDAPVFNFSIGKGVAA